MFLYVCNSIQNAKEAIILYTCSSSNPTNKNLSGSDMQIILSLQLLSITFLILIMYNGECVFRHEHNKRGFIVSMVCY
jgi:hypothetical protein